MSPLVIDAITGVLLMVSAGMLAGVAVRLTR